MSISAPSTTHTNNPAIWSSLKQAIAASSGFQHWDAQLPNVDRANSTLEARVQRYLRDTLETLAY